MVLTCIVFGQTLRHDFVNYDDQVYVYNNWLVSSGVSLNNFLQAFVDTQTGNWHPITLISHMIDCQLFGLKAGGHHFTNVVFHSVAVILLFVFLQRVTGRIWPSAFAAALFAIHPLRVESVAWIAERKDVLSAVFFILTLLAYHRYVVGPSSRRYLTTSIFFACGLLSKAMLVTVPVLLVVLDYWPFQKIDSAATFRRALLGKVPLAVLAFISAIVTFVLQEARSHSIPQLPFSWRAQNAIVSYVTYLCQMVWPSRLGVFYPHPEDHLAVWQVAGAVVLLVTITILVVRWRRPYPYLFVGWLWFVIMLLPVIGIIEVGLQGHADRYTYLPQIGLYIAITWLVADLTKPLAYRKQVLTVAGVAIVITLAACAYKQTTYWQNGETLWRHTLAVTSDNDIAHTNLGTLLVERGNFDEALTHFQTALAIRLRSPESALSHYRLSLSLLHNDIGNALGRKGRVGEAIKEFRQAVAFQPDYANALHNLGTALFQEGFYDEAIEQWTAALSLTPNDAAVHTGLGNALIQKHQLREALSHFERAAQIDPAAVIALNNRAWILAMSPDESVRDGRTAVELARRANAISGNKNAIFMRTLGAAYAEVGDFENATDTARRAEQLAAAQGQQGLVSQIEDEMNLYRRHEPLRDSSLTDAAKNP